MRHAVLVVILFLCRTCTDAQRLVFKNYTVNDGLVANTIRCIFQDSKGFLWIGTWEGLSKYDGYQFTNYSTAKGLSGNVINDIHESKDGRLYVAANEGGINVVSESSAVGKTVSQKTIINRFLDFSPGHVIVTTDQDDIQEFRNEKLIKPEQPFNHYSYSNIIRLDDSLFMTATDTSIRVFTPEYKLWAEIKNSNPVFTECMLYMDSQKRIWVGSYSTGLKLLLLSDLRNKQPAFVNVPAPFNIPVLQQNHINALFEDDKGTIWIGTTVGLVKIGKDGSSQLITSKEGLAADNITCIFQDNEKNMWFGSPLGLSKLVTRSNIRVYTVENGLSSNNMYYVYPVKKGHLLVLTNTDAQVFNTSTGKFLSLASNITQFFYNIVPWNDPLLLFGSKTIVAFDTAVLQYREKTFFSFANSFYSMTGNNKGNFFMGDGSHLYFLSGKDGKPEIILDRRSTCFLVDKDDCFWAGTWDDGLYRFRYAVDQGKIKILAKDQYLPREGIRSLFQDSHGNIWAGTRYHGVYLLKKGKEDFQISNIDQSKGLTSNFVKWIREDKSGNIWLACYQGLDKLIKHDTSYRVFNFSKVNNYFASIANFEIDEENSLWLAAAEGMTRIKDGELESLPPLPVYITGISSPDSTYAVNTASLDLNYRHNQLQFEFSSPGFVNENQLLYSYRLTGSSNSEWTKPVNEHSVSYANLQPGTYRFEVRNKGWNGEWGNITSFEFVILPPFWKTWWFILLLSLAAIGLIYFLIKRRIATIRHEADMKNKIAETEMMALRAQMNPHFIFNCLNSIDNLIQNNEKEKATTYLAKFAKLIRAILENSKNNTIPCWKDMETLQLYLELEELRCDSKFSYRISVAIEIMNGDYKVPPLVIQPFVENAIHHGLMNKKEKDKDLYIAVSAENNEIKYVIEDNGIGRSKAEEYKRLNKSFHHSMGMEITMERINLFNKQKRSVKITDLYDEHKHPAGTKVEVSLINQN